MSVQTGGITFATYGNTPYGNATTIQPYNTQNANWNNSGNQMAIANYSSTIPASLPGKIVGGENDILPQDVPMNGTFSVFVQQDLQRVYVKKWEGDGNIHGNTYVLEQQNVPDQNGASIDATLISILERLENIEKSLQRPKKPHNPNYKKNPKQKEAAQNEYHE